MSLVGSKVPLTFKGRRLGAQLPDASLYRRGAKLRVHTPSLLRQQLGMVALPIVGHHAGEGDFIFMSQPFLSTLMWAVGQMCRSCSEEETIPGLATDFMSMEEVSVVGSSLNETFDLYVHTHTQNHTYTES